MLYLIAILVAFCGGLLARAVGFGSVPHRLFAFIIPIALSAALMHVPMLMEILRSGLPPLSWGALQQLSISQFIILMSAVLLTSLGWFCSYCVQNVFED